MIPRFQMGSRWAGGLLDLVVLYHCFPGRRDKVHWYMVWRSSLQWSSWQDLSVEALLSSPKPPDAKFQYFLAEMKTVHLQATVQLPA